MVDKKRIDEVVNRIANRGMASTHAPRSVQVPRAIHAPGVSVPQKVIGPGAGGSPFVARMAAGKAKAKANRASSTAPPTPAKAKSGPANLNTVKPPKTKIPTPASSGSGPMQPTGPHAGGHVEIHFHNK